MLSLFIEILLDVSYKYPQYTNIQKKIAYLPLVYMHKKCKNIWLNC